MAIILISIKPEYSDKIFSGIKKYEFRHRLSSQRIDKIVVYTTSPVKKIVGEVEVVGKKEAPPTLLWEMTKNEAGITLEKYRKYFQGHTIAKAYVLGKATLYSKPYDLDEFGITHAPQSFVYLPQCPFCGKVMTRNVKDYGISTSRSEEHIIPFALGNETLVLPQGTICDECNHYFAIKIEQEFFSIEAIKQLRSYHMIPSRKRRIPNLRAVFGKENVEFSFDVKNKCAYIGLTAESIKLLLSGKRKWFFTKGISIDELANNYVISRFLVKVFVEACLFYSLEYYKESCPRVYEFDKAFYDLIKYVRYGSKDNRIYDYSVLMYKKLEPLSTDDFVANVKINNENDTITGMTLRLFELEFQLRI